jgi:hypothetical protein
VLELPYFKGGRSEAALSVSHDVYSLAALGAAIGGDMSMDVSCKTQCTHFLAQTDINSDLYVQVMHIAHIVCAGIDLETYFREARPTHMQCNHTRYAERGIDASTPPIMLAKNHTESWESVIITSVDQAMPSHRPPPPTLRDRTLLCPLSPQYRCRICNDSQLRSP